VSHSQNAHHAKLKSSNLTILLESKSTSSKISRKLILVNSKIKDKNLRKLLPRRQMIHKAKKSKKISLTFLSSITMSKMIVLSARLASIAIKFLSQMSGSTSISNLTAFLSKLLVQSVIKISQEMTLRCLLTIAINRLKIN
jgi:hypothetical protein